MEGNVRNISEYLRGATKLIIPVYQRNYDWKRENCELLFEDLIDLETIHKLEGLFEDFRLFIKINEKMVHAKEALKKDAENFDWENL